MVKNHDKPAYPSPLLFHEKLVDFVTPYQIIYFQLICCLGDINQTTTINQNYWLWKLTQLVAHTLLCSFVVLYIQVISCLLPTTVLSVYSSQSNLRSLRFSLRFPWQTCLPILPRKTCGLTFTGRHSQLLQLLLQASIDCELSLYRLQTVESPFIFTVITYFTSGCYYYLISSQSNTKHQQGTLQRHNK